MGGIRAIIFDLDNTLWDVWPVIVRAEHAMHDFLALHYPRVTERHDLRSMRDVRARMAIDHPAMRHDFTWLRLEALRHHAREAGYPETMADQAFEAFYRARNEVTLYDDVRPALDELARDYRLFALSNGNADLARCGVGAVFRAGPGGARRRDAQARPAHFRDPARACRARSPRGRARRRRRGSRRRRRARRGRAAGLAESRSRGVAA